jgi:phosphatidylserine/phosphatidylglycerophosphate/cardiolipin synthase-like enzyme
VQIVVEPSDDAAGLVNAIQNAKTSVHMTMYLLSNTKVIDALIAQQKAGHDVKVLLNEQFPSSGGNSGSNTSSYNALQSAGVNVKWAPGAGSFYTHEKGVMIDGQIAWIMTMNATQSSPTQNREYLAVDSDPADVNEAEQIFAADWANQSIVPKGKLVVAPTNAHSELTTLIGMATSTIDMEAEELSDRQVLSALSAAGDRGIKVRVVLADAQSTTASAALKQHGVKLVTYSSLYVHAKSIVVDSKYAYVGSENFSGGSLGYNRELGVVTDAASEVSKVESTTSSDFAGGTPL